ncbi:PH domain-containing protein [Amycolatopsis rhizosphaerae]|nr:PH domain-containing protein [Amycolatopsis rhizosphaerae]
MTIRLGGPSRRRIRWSFGGFTVVWGGLWIAAAVSALRHGTLAQTLILTAVFLAVWLPAALFITLLAAGNTRIGPAGLRLRGAFTRGFIAWDEVAEIKDRFHQGRRGGWWTVEAHLANGRVRRLPGFYCEGPTPDRYSRPKRDGDFDAQLTEVRRRLRHRQGA